MFDTLIDLALRFSSTKCRIPILAGDAQSRREGLTLERIDLFEVNEAFATVPLHFMRELDVAPDKVNVNGCATALGHPLDATGVMLAGTLIDELERRRLRFGVAMLCIGGGLGVAAVFERL